MPCDAVSWLLPDLAAGELSDEEADALESHLEGCPACRAELATLTTRYMLGELGEGVADDDTPAAWTPANDPGDAPQRWMWLGWVAAAASMLLWVLARPPEPGVVSLGAGEGSPPALERAAPALRPLVEAQGLRLPLAGEVGEGERLLVSAEGARVFARWPGGAVELLPEEGGVLGWPPASVPPDHVDLIGISEDAPPPSEVELGAPDWLRRLRARGEPFSHLEVRWAPR